MAPPSSAHVSAAAVATGSLGSWRVRSTSGRSVAVVACGRRSAEERVICSSVRAPANLSCSSSVAVITTLLSYVYVGTFSLYDAWKTYLTNNNCSIELQQCESSRQPLLSIFYKSETNNAEWMHRCFHSPDWRRGQSNRVKLQANCTQERNLDSISL